MFKEIQHFFKLVYRYTILPVPQVKTFYLLPNSQQSIHYLSLLGWLVGGIGALAYWISLDFASPSVALLFSMLLTLLITGASQQNSFSRVFEAFIKKSLEQRIYQIQKPQTQGTAMLSMIPLILLKFWALLSIPIIMIPLVMIAGHSLSHWSASITSYIFDPMQYGFSFKKLFNITMATFWGILPLAFLGNAYWFWLIIPILFFTWLIGFILQRRLLFFSEDYLAVNQQLTEVGFYLILMALYPYFNEIVVINGILVINV